VIVSILFDLPFSIIIIYDLIDFCISIARKIRNFRNFNGHSEQLIPALLLLSVGCFGIIEIASVGWVVIMMHYNLLII
jgi:hypothetical protein